MELVLKDMLVIGKVEGIDLFEFFDVGFGGIGFVVLDLFRFDFILVWDRFILVLFFFLEWERIFCVI